MRAGLKSKYSKFKQKSMAFFNRRRSFRRNRSFNRPRFRRSFGGSNRIPFVGRIIPRSLQPLIVLAALVGGAWYFFKEPLKGLLDKIKSHTS